MAEYRALIVLLASFAGGAGLAFALGRAGWRRGVLAVAGLAAAGMAAGTALSQSDDGWAGLGWFLFVLLFALPAFAGACLGGWLGLRAHRRRHG